MIRKKQVNNKGSRHFHIVGLCLFCQITSVSYAAIKPPQILRLGGYIIPSSFTQALEQGMTIPVFLQYVGGDHNEQGEKIAHAVLAIKEGRLLIQEVKLADREDGAQLSSETKALITSIESRQFDEKSEIVISDNATLALDIKSFRLKLNVARDAIGASLFKRTTRLDESSVPSITGLVNYDLGIFHNRNRQSGNNTNSYITLDNYLSYKEHHLNLNGAIYGSGHGSNQLYRAMYEHDYAGRRLALGMVDTWNLQSLGNLSALHSQRIYGASYGNKADSISVNASVSLTPIMVFLPQAGEVHVTRDGRLLSIQNFSMGSYEVDTRSFPFGSYDVEVDVVVDGRSISKTTERVNKTLSKNSAAVNDLSWQIFGGMLKTIKQNYKAKNEQYAQEQKKKDTYLFGISVASTLPQLNSLSLWSTNYAFDGTFVMENGVSFSPVDKIQLSIQSLLASDRSWRFSGSINASLPGNVGSVWATREKSRSGSNIASDDADNLSYGFRLNIDRFIPRAGAVTLSETRNYANRYKSMNVNYSTKLLSGRYGSVNLRAGMQRYQYADRNKVTQRYAALDFSIPVGRWFSLGVSNRKKSTALTASFKKTFEESFVSAMGVDVSKRLTKGQGDAENFSVNGYAAFNNKYTSGTIAASRPSKDSVNTNLTAHGSVGWSGRNIAMSGDRNGTSGVLIKTDIQNKGELAARIDGQTYKLSGKNNFIPLQPYKNYTVELMNSKTSKESFDVVNGRVSSATLYPGNVAVIKPEIKQMVTVFGRLVTASGQGMKNAHVKNHIGKAKTDNNGDFAIDVDKRYPIITLVSSENGTTCEIPLDLKKAEGVYWAGELDCGTIYAQNGR